MQRYDHTTEICGHSCTCCFKQLNNKKACLKRRTKDYVVKTMTHTLKRDSREDWFHQMLILYMPFRSEDELKQSDETYEESFNRNKKAVEDMCTKLRPGRSGLEAIQNIDQHVTNVMREAATSSQDAVDEQDDNGDLITAEDVTDHRPIDKNELETRVKELGTEQRRVYDKVFGHMRSNKSVSWKTGCECSIQISLVMFRMTVRTRSESSYRA